MRTWDRLRRQWFQGSIRACVYCIYIKWIFFVTLAELRFAISLEAVIKVLENI